MKFLKKGPELFTGAGHILGDHADLADDSHEIRIAAPPGNDVDVEMIVDSGSRRLAQVHADVEPLRLHGLR